MSPFVNASLWTNALIVVFMGPLPLALNSGLTGPGEPGRHERAEGPTPREFYEVRAGDSLERLGLSSGCTVWELRYSNRLKTDVIHVGDRLKIPACGGRHADANEASSDSYRVAGGDTLGGVAQLSGCSIAMLQRANGLEGDAIRGGEVLRIPDCEKEEIRRLSVADRGVSRGETKPLEPLMRQQGFRPPEKFRALVTVVDFDRVGQGRTVTGQRRFEYGGAGADVRGWNPASTVKLYSAVSALQRVEANGFTRAARVEFQGHRRPYRTTVGALVEEALVASDNIAHNRLVQLAGFNTLNRLFFSADNGFARSAILRAYQTRTWMGMGEAASFQEPPTIVLREAQKKQTLRPESSNFLPPCGGAVCTSLRDLSESLTRLMLGEQLPEGVGYHLSDASRRWLQGILSTRRARGEEVVARLRSEFAKVGREKVRIYHKSGYSQRWYSDVAYVYVGDRPRAYVVALAGYPGRESLNEAATIIGKLLATETIR